MQLNQIAIAVHGYTFDLYVNHKQIASAQNNDYLQGLIGLVVMAQPSTTTEVLYTNPRSGYHRCNNFACFYCPYGQKEVSPTAIGETSSH